MIDIHSHIIPEVDDGARSLEEAFVMCKMAWEDGTRVMAATPHAYNGVYGYDEAKITLGLGLLKERLHSEQIQLEIVLGAEVYSSPDLPVLLKQKPRLTLNGKQRYFLLEFPHSVIPPRADEAIFQLAVKNFIPIIVHPERNLHVQGQPESLRRLVELGAFCQATAMSFTGGFGKRAAECAFKLLQMGCIHMVASDAHNEKGRPPLLSRARQEISAHIGAEKARDLFEVFPKKVLDGEA